MKSYNELQKVDQRWGSAQYLCLINDATLMYLTNLQKHWETTAPPEGKRTTDLRIMYNMFPLRLFLCAYSRTWRKERVASLTSCRKCDWCIPIKRVSFLLCVFNQVFTRNKDNSPATHTPFIRSLFSLLSRTKILIICFLEPSYHSAVLWSIILY